MFIWLGRTPSGTVVWRGESVCLNDEVTWLGSVPGSEAGREEWVGKEASWGAGLAVKLDPCCFITAFPFGLWQSSGVYVISKDYLSPPFVTTSGKFRCHPESGTFISECCGAYLEHFPCWHGLHWIRFWNQIYMMLEFSVCLRLHASCSVSISCGWEP